MNEMADNCFKYFAGNFEDNITGLEFQKFLKQSEIPRIRLDGSNLDTGMWCTSVVTGLHRWKPEYKKRVIRKMQSLNDWYNCYKYPVTMITFTTRQKGLSIPDQITFLKSNFVKAKDVMRKVSKFPYFWVIEPHKTGFGHIHCLAFKEFSSDERDNIRKLWVEKYKAGVYQAAPKFVMKKNSIHLESAAAYVIKYMKKTMEYDLLKNDDSGYFKFSSWVWKMSRHDTDYKGVRIWGCSQDISQVIAYQGEPDTGVRWWRVNYLLPDTEDGWFSLWVDEDMAAFPERVYEFDRAFKSNFDNVSSCGDRIEFL